MDTNLLLCPLDGEPLKRQGASSWGCDNNHSFDIAKQGYVNLLPVQHKRSKHPGDSPEMIVARKRFLDSGAYEAIALHLSRQLANLAKDRGSLVCLDAGCGEGYYLGYIRQYLKQQLMALPFAGYGIDISKHAIVAAAKRDKHITWIVGSNKQPPILRQSLDVLLCMFGFPSYDVFARLLKQDGVLIMVDPNPNHLYALRDVLYDEVLVKSVVSHQAALDHGFILKDEVDIRYTACLDTPQQIMDLAMMTPHYFRAKSDARAKLEQLTELDISVDVSIKTFCR